MKKTSWLLYLLLAVIIALVFQRAFNAEYLLWDDDVLVLNNPILKMPFWDAVKTSFSVYYHGDYFPLTLLSYWLDIRIAGANAPFQHSVNLCLHIISTLLLLSCLLKLTKNYALSFLITLIFAIHPLQVESVMWISERKSLLSAVFTFLSLQFYLKSQDKKYWYVLAVFFYVCAGLTKATALLMPLLFVLLDFNSLKDRQHILKRFIPMGILAAGLVFLRIQAYTASVGGQDWDTQYLSSIPLRAFTAMGFYWQAFFWPMKTSAIYPDFEMNLWAVVFAAVLGLLFVVGTMYAFKKDFFTRFSWLWFVLFLLPVLQIIPRINFVNERYMYLPIIGFAGFFISFFKAKYYWLIVGFCGVLMAVTSFHHSNAWMNNRNLWQQTLTVVPQSAIVLNNLGLEYQNTGNFSEAIKLYQKVLSSPNDGANRLLAYNNLANIYSDSRSQEYAPEKAIALYREGIASTQRIRDTYEMRINLGSLLLATGSKEEGSKLLKEVMVDLQKESDHRFQWLKPMVQKQLDSLGY